MLTGERLAQPDMAYNAGYSACANEALRHVGEMDNISVASRQRLVDRLTAHLRRSTVTPCDDVTAMTSPATCDVTVAPRRRLYDDECCQETVRRSHRRPLADIQPSIGRDPPPVCRSKIAAAASSTTGCRLPFPFPQDVASYSSDVTADEFPPSTQVLSRCVTLTQTMTTTLHEDRQRDDVTQASANHVQSVSRCLSADAMLIEPVWRPW